MAPPQQFDLLGIPAATRPTDRLFFAIFPDAATAAAIAQLAQHLRAKHGLRGRPIATERFHITLHHLGDHAGVPADIVKAASAASATLRKPPFDVVFDRAESFRKPRNNPFVLRGEDGLAGLTAFQQTLGAALAKHGLGRYVNPQFTPHVTLHYDQQSVAGQAIAPIRWTVREFALVHSLLGQTRHLLLARWPLLV